MSPSTDASFLHFGGELEAPSGVVVRPVTMRPDRRLEFLGGPLPVSLPSNATTADRGGAALTDEKARRTLVGSQQSDILYGRESPRPQTHRWHRILDEADGFAPECVAIECFLGPDDNPRNAARPGYLVLHLSGAPTINEHLDLVHPHSLRRPSGLWTEVAEAVGATLDVHAGVRRLNFMATTEDDGFLPAYGLLSGSPSRRLGDLAPRADERTFTLSRSDWSALILRDGATFVSHQKGAESFGPTLRSHVHSVYTDALLLALLQRRLVDESGEAAVHATLSSPEALAKLEKDYFDFKRRYWRVSLTDKRNSPTDDIFRAFQAQLLTPLDVEDVEERVMNGARVARTMYAERQATEQEQLGRRLEEGSAFIGSFLFAYTAAAVTRDPSWTTFVVATFVGLLGMFASVGFIRWSRRRARDDSD